MQENGQNTTPNVMPFRRKMSQVDIIIKELQSQGINKDQAVQEAVTQVFFPEIKENN